MEGDFDGLLDGETVGVKTGECEGMKVGEKVGAQKHTWVFKTNLIKR